MQHIILNLIAYFINFGKNFFLQLLIILFLYSTSNIRIFKLLFKLNHFYPSFFT